MFGNLNLDLVKAYQNDLRHEADSRRLATKANRAIAKQQSGQTRRVFGLRLSPAA